MTLRTLNTILLGAAAILAALYLAALANLLVGVLL